MKLARRHAKRGRVEIIPMIDTILILLIFYMSFSQFKVEERRIDANLPVYKAVAGGAVAEELEYILHVKDHDNIVVNGGAVLDAISLRDAMLTLASIGQKVRIIIEAEPDTVYEDVIAALDACALAQLTKVAFRPLAEAPATP